MTRRAPSLGASYLALLGVLLVGYAFLHRGFAYLGVPPLYIGEMVLATGLAVVLAGGCSATILRTPLVWAILAFATWGALITMAHMERYGIVALRDAVVWMYSAFALILAGVFLRAGSPERAVAWYGRWSPWLLLWAPFGLAIMREWPGAMPKVPLSDIGVLSLKPGDFAVHLAGAAAFMLLGLRRRRASRLPAWVFTRDLLLWWLLLIGLVVNGSHNRGGLLAFMAALGVIALLGSTKRIKHLMVSLIVVATVFTALDIRIPLPRNREISAVQIYANVESIFFQSEKLTLTQTTEWRLQWWKKIVGYTVHGEYFWTGKGYGVDLAASDGFKGEKNRNPHNGHLTVLARSGVPGFALWLVLQGMLFTTLFRAYHRARRLGETQHGKMVLWTMSYLTASVINMSFDVYLEGPQGGIWYWCLVGFAIALTTRRQAATRRVAILRTDPARSWA